MAPEKALEILLRISQEFGKSMGVVIDGAWGALKDTAALTISKQEVFDCFPFRRK